jgi:hypothetical protein
MLMSVTLQVAGEYRRWSSGEGLVYSLMIWA